MGRPGGYRSPAWTSRVRGSRSNLYPVPCDWPHVLGDRILGVLGGMGPEATAYFISLVTELTPAERDQDHIPMVVISDPKIPDRSEAILSGGPSPVGRALRDLRMLESLGVELVAIPCNTFFHFYEEVARGTSLEIVHMPRLTAELLADAGARAVGLLGTTGLVRSGLYQRLLADMRIEVVLPDEQTQAEVMRAIYEIKAGRKSGARLALIRASRRLLDHGAQLVVEGCTEAPLVLRGEPLPLLDPMEVMARACVDRFKGTALLSELRAELAERVSRAQTRGPSGALLR
ncbi:MAG TPA: aspartate/glutamate racemase family protein [Candidatus Korarchaeota archaeon]|nr:aspartate/glutamate racemase family protein [Candidatus Korarchaeota archaeon]